MKSAIGFPKRQKDTLRGLGLLRRHRVVEVNDTPSARGMVYKVRHLVRVLGEKDKSKPVAWKGDIVVPGPRTPPEAKKAAKDVKGKNKKSKAAGKPAKK